MLDRQASKEEIDVLARTIYGEARNQGLAGMLAVAQVVLNRVDADLRGDGKPDWWGEGIIAVCKKPRQFSTWNPGDPNRMVIESVSARQFPLFAQALAVAEMATSGLAMPLVGRATHYYAVNIAVPDWARGKKPVVVIRDHRFFEGV